MKVAVICEFSGVVRDAFIARGHDAISFDLLPTENPGPHRQGDIMDLSEDYWKYFDLAICHPPCTYLCNSGVSWLKRKPERPKQMYEAAMFFNFMLNLPIRRIAVENPIMHKYAKSFLDKNYDQIIQPWMFGHMEQKATCLWLKNLPSLSRTNDVREEMNRLPNKQRQRIHYLPPSKERWKQRSKTFQGIADAMADQWGAI